jgi:ribosomal RNA-processing protein 12
MLFDLSLTSDVLTCKDNGVQKRGYKILTKVIESGKVDVDVESTLKKLDELVDGLNVAAKKVCDSQCLRIVLTLPQDRFNLLAALVPFYIRLPCILSHLFFQKLPWARKSRRKKQEQQHSI